MFREEKTQTLQPIVQLQHECVSIEGLESIRIQCAGAYIQVLASKSDQLEIELWDVQDTPQEEFFAALRDGNRLELEQGLDRGVLGMKRHRQTRLSISLPRSYGGELTLQSNTGAVQFEGRYSFRKLSIESAQGGVFAPVGVVAQELTIMTASGGQFLGELSVGSANLSSASGTIEVEYVEGDRVKVYNASGAVTVKKMRVKGLDVTTASGAVGLWDAHAEERAVLSTASGAICVRELRAGDFDVSSASGKIGMERLTGAGKLGSDVGDVGVERLEPRGDLHVRSTLGEVKIGVLPDVPVQVSIESMMGKMETDLPGAVRRSGSVSGGAEDATATIYVRTMSGNVSVMRA